MFGRLFRITLYDQLLYQQHVVMLAVDTVLYIAVSFLRTTRAWYFINNSLQRWYMTRRETKRHNGTLLMDLCVCVSV
jgi:hypothetical protein